MGKKRTANADAGRTRFELRFDDSVYTDVKQMADDMQISVNQLMQGMARWLITNAHLGDPEKVVGKDGRLLAVRKQTGSKVQAGAVWFGEIARFARLTHEEATVLAESQVAPESVESCVDHLMDDDEGKIVDQGVIYGHLDFTERRVVVED